VFFGIAWSLRGHLGKAIFDVLILGSMSVAALWAYARARRAVIMISPDTVRILNNDRVAIFDIREAHVVHWSIIDGTVSIEDSSGKCLAKIGTASAIRARRIANLIRRHIQERQRKQSERK